jgi:hypothetical protein
MSDPKSEKPYKLESIPRPWTETDVETWWLTVMDFLKSVTRYKKSMNEDKEWKPKRFPNRGFTGTQAADRSDLIDSILLKIAKNDSEQIHKLRICRECNSKGFPSARNKLVQYFSDKNSFDISKDDFNSHYWNMRDIRISCLLKKESDITFEGAAINCDHDENFCRRAQ